MILELKEFLTFDDVEFIRNSIKPFIPEKRSYAYNREGKTVNVSETPELKEVDNLIFNVLTEVLTKLVIRRFNPLRPSRDSGYEYHLYEPGDMCLYHSDGEVDHRNNLRYATVVMFLTDNPDGKLIFPAQNREIVPEVGKIAVFPPTGLYSHYTQPSKTNREVIVTWLVYDGVTVKFE